MTDGMALFAIVGGLIGFVFGAARAVGDLADARQDADLWKQSKNECNRQYNILLAEKRDLQRQYDRASDLVAKYQAKQPVRGKDGKFRSKA